MKNKLFKVAPMLLLGVSLSACTLLSDLGIGGKSDITKFAKNKNEVTLKEFVDKVKSSIKDTDYIKDDYQMPDSKLIAGVKVEASQKLTSEKASVKTRNEASAKLNLTADGAFDKDNDSLNAKVEGSYSVSEKNATLGEGSTKYSTKLDATFMPNGRNVQNQVIYAIVDNKNEMYRSLVVGDNFTMGNLLSFGMNSAMKYLSNFSIGEEFNEAEFNKMLAQYGLTLKYYDDSNVMTVTGEWKYSFDLKETKAHYEYITDPETGITTYTEVIDSETVYGKASVEANLKFQFKVVKVVKLRALFNGSLTADYVEDHAQNINKVWPFGITGFSGDCYKGDKEVIELKAEAGINLEHESVTNKLPDLSKYQNVTPPEVVE